MDKRLITIDDIVDVYSKTRQRGAKFILSKFHWNGLSRTQSAFDESAVESSNWWIIPKVRARWNEKISGDPKVNYEQYMMNEIFKGRKNLRLISLGSGICSHEIELAQYDNFSEIICLDVAQNRLDEAKKEADRLGLSNMKFSFGSIYDFHFQKEYYDIVLFNASLHHFKNVESLIQETLLPTLKLGGNLVINEYVGPDRLQFPKEQILAINQGIQLIPKDFRTRFKLSLKKNHFYGSGWMRMILADPSECIDSAAIMPSIHKHFDVIVERPYGGNILMNVLKDIAHHFVHLNKEKEQYLNELFLFEDQYLQNHNSDFIFGVYAKREQ